MHDSVAVLLFNVTRSVLVMVKQFRPAVLLAASLSGPDDAAASLSGPDDAAALRPSSVSGFTLELCAGILDKQGE